MAWKSLMQHQRPRTHALPCPDAVSSLGKGYVPNQKSDLAPSTREVRLVLQALAQAAPSKLMIWNPSKTKTVSVASNDPRSLAFWRQEQR